MDYDTTSLASGVAGGLDIAARNYANGKIADSIVKVNPEFLSQMGLSREEFGGMSATEKTARITGAITALGLRTQAARAQQQAQVTQAQLEDYQAQAEDRRQQAALRTQQAQEDDALGQAIQRYAVGPPSTPLVPGGAFGPVTDMLNNLPPSPQDRQNYALQTSGLGGRGSLKLMETLNRLGLTGAKSAKGLPMGQQMNLADGTIITGMGEANEPNIRPPKEPKTAEKPLSDAQEKHIASLDQAENDLNELEKLYQNLGPDWGGPITGRMMKAQSGYDKDYAAVQNAIKAATPNLARGVFGEIGVLTDEDRRQYEALLPGPMDTKEVRDVKFDQLKKKLAFARQSTLGNLSASGRNVSGFADKSKGAENLPQFDNLSSAIAGGAKPGDAILIKQPGGGYARMVLKKKS